MRSIKIYALGENAYTYDISSLFKSKNIFTMNNAPAISIPHISTFRVTFIWRAVWNNSKLQPRIIQK